MYIGTYHLKVATGGILVQIIFFYFNKVQVLKGAGSSKFGFYNSENLDTTQHYFEKKVMV